MKLMIADEDAAETETRERILDEIMEWKGQQKEGGVTAQRSKTCSKERKICRRQSMCFRKWSFRRGRKERFSARV